MNRPIIGVIKRKINAQILYMRLRSMFLVLPIMLKVAPPSKEQCEEILVALAELRVKLGVEMAEESPTPPPKVAPRPKSVGVPLPPVTQDITPHSKFNIFFASSLPSSPS